MYVPCILYSLLTRPTNAQHICIYIYINNILYIVINPTGFDVLLTVHLSIFISVINQLDAQYFRFTISLFHTSTCFEHM